MKYFASLCCIALISLSMAASTPRQRINLDKDWEFAFGNASSPEKDWGAGTEYFNYYTKAASIHNAGPYSTNQNFDSVAWAQAAISVDLPHDWVVDLPFAPEASHSHGYKSVGYKYPETSVGWYRKIIDLPEQDKGKHFSLQFDGIFRDAKVWVNGFYLGHEPSGYASQVYDISEYLNYGGSNLITVRADATFEEGWFYEGGGIYRHVWLDVTDPLHVVPFGTFVYTDLDAPYDKAIVNIETTVKNYDAEPRQYSLKHILLDKDGQALATAQVPASSLNGKQQSDSKASIYLEQPNLWSLDDPYLYTVRTEVYEGDRLADVYDTRFGIRDVAFDKDKGFLLNGQAIKLKGANMHQDHAGVGAAIPDDLQEYRIRQLKKYGFNAYRASHNPMSPAMLDVCDSLGMLVIDENRLSGINHEHITLLDRMIRRDRNHPSIILWGLGNEEWGTEWNDYGHRISESMREYAHQFDPTRMVTFASSSGPTVLVPVDVAGYNYILQNPVEQHRADYPERKAIGTEETSGCGTRGVYYDDRENGHMAALNRSKNGPDSVYNCIERGWKFYDERPWLGGLFYWTGFDYRGEANPLVYPATGSEFGILDYCGFPKDEAYYLQAWWTDEPVLHLLPHWNLTGHEGEKVDIWAYSNCDQVQLWVNGEDKGIQDMPKNGHLQWQSIYQPGMIKAIGYKDGKAIIEEIVETTGPACQMSITPSKQAFSRKGDEVIILDLALQDANGRFVPDACDEITVEISGPAFVLGAGNGDPAFLISERPAPRESKSSFTMPAFNGHAQFLIQSMANDTGAPVNVTLSSPKLQPVTLRY